MTKAAAEIAAAKDAAKGAVAVQSLSFEQALAELEGLVTKLERGDVPLEESIAAYERGEALKAHCSRLLSAAEARVEKIRLGADGKPAGLEPLDVE
ncbi:exodeoxyribonuclease VII small subunit [Prosthecodimorpha staleyi]|uniref:exodeoxyribonuclease VII small subunit n=1 Tax=Prosthecodimorpha staleyi TaxID=2840188 RepID=UPI0036F33EAA